MKAKKLTTHLLLGAFFCASSLIITDLKAQENSVSENSINISYQLRPRIEFRDGNFTPANKNTAPAALISQRDRLSIDYKYKDLLTVHFAPQSVSIWGQANMVQGAEMSANQISMFESWAQLKLHSFWNVKFGRQIISLDDERFFGALDWAQGARAHDALSFGFHKNKYELKGFFAFNQNYKTLYGNNLNNPAGNLYNAVDALPYKTMQTIWGNIPLNESMRITLLASNLGIQNAVSALDSVKTGYLQTFGANFFEKGKHLSLTISGYYQMAKNTKAYMGSVFADYAVNSAWNIGLGSDLVSGNDFGSPITENAIFNPFFHTGHKFYGSMDYFYSGNGHGGVGLSDNYAKINFKSEKGYSVNLAIHQFITPNKVKTPSKEYDSNLGQEIDLTINYKINKFASLVGGYSFFLNTPTLNVLKTKPNAKDYQQWGWLSINLNPTIFKTIF